MKHLFTIMLFSGLFIFAACETNPAKNDNNADSVTNNPNPTLADTAALPSTGIDPDSMRTDTTKRPVY